MLLQARSMGVFYSDSADDFGPDVDAGTEIIETCSAPITSAPNVEQPPVTQESQPIAITHDLSAIPPPPPSPRLPNVAAYTRVSSIAELVGVRPSDGQDEQHRVKRDKPRRVFRPVHAVMAILLLSAALCASLTMLVQQSMRYAAAKSSSTTMTQGKNAGNAGSAGSAETVDGDDNAASSSAGTAYGEDDDSTGTNDNNTTDEHTVDGTAETLETNADSDVSMREGAGVDGMTSTGDAVIDGSSTSGNTVGLGGSSALDNSSGSQVTDSRINLNTATADQLDTVPGIGPVTAQRILDHRKRIGRFSTIDQLLDVSGIGTKTLEKIRPWVRV